MAPHRQMQMVVTRFERLSRRISLAGLMSGHKAEAAITEGRVKVDDVEATANFKVFSEAVVTVDDVNVPAPAPSPKLWGFFKPKKVLCTTDEKEGVTTLRSLMRTWDEKTKKRMGAAQFRGLERDAIHDKHFIIVCGLAYNCDGLVVCTNDGLFADALFRTESKILSVFDVKVAGDPPLQLLHDWRKAKGTRANGVNFGQVFCSITSRTSSATRLRVRYVETPERPLEMLLDKNGLRVNRLRRYGFGPYQLAELPDAGLVQLPIHASLQNLVPKADMRQVLVPTAGGVLDQSGRINTVGLQNTAIFQSGNKKPQPDDPVPENDLQMERHMSSA